MSELCSPDYPDESYQWNLRRIREIRQEMASLMEGIRKDYKLFMAVCRIYDRRKQSLLDKQTLYKRLDHRLALLDCRLKRVDAVGEEKKRKKADNKNSAKRAIQRLTPEQKQALLEQLMGK